jgi:predicted naringenin-chalcone synthase
MTAANPILCDFRSVNAKNRVPQKEVLEWLASAHALAETRQDALSIEQKEAVSRKIKKLVMRFGCSTDRVEIRGSVLDDFLHQNWDEMKVFFLGGKASGASAEVRSQIYSEVVSEVFARFYAEETLPPSAIMHVTCTGYVSPSGAQRLVAAKGWGESTEVLHSYHMGCYAALPSIRVASGLIVSGKPSVDLVHTELCTLHLDPTQHHPEQLVMQTLFADGLIRYRLAGSLPLGETRGLEVVAAREEIIRDTQDAMTWIVSDNGMKMTLSRKVPDYIGSVLGDFMRRLLAPTGLDLETVRRNAVFAVHPGGPRIIDQVQGLLEISDRQVSHSNSILKNYGNMSSATLPHIWERMLHDPEIPEGTWIPSLAFGPGLTVSGMLLRKVARS